LREKSYASCERLDNKYTLFKIKGPTNIIAMEKSIVNPKISATLLTGAPH
jgi:hypothetical protein